MNTIIQPAGQLTSSPVTKGGEATAQLHDRNIWQKVGLVALSTVKWIVIVLLALIAAFLVGLSIIWGPTPLYVAPCPWRQSGWASLLSW